jgi:hypothetical protein
MKKLILLTCFCLVCVAASAQRQELGFLLGGATYKGELNPVFLDSRFFSPAAGVFHRYNFNRYFSWKTNAYYGFIRGNDALSSNAFEKNRNLSFHSEVLDVSTGLEFNFFPYEIGNPKFPFATYVFTGISLYKFNPKAYYTDPLTGITSLEELQPLGTEGQGTTVYPHRKEYSLTQLGIPMGGGIKINVGEIGIGLEIGARYTFNDYLDDVSSTYVDKQVLLSQSGERSAVMSDRSLSGDAKPGGLRGNPENNDWYMFGGITIYFRLDKRRNMCNPFHFQIQENYNN